MPMGKIAKKGFPILFHGVVGENYDEINEDVK